jgi:hypothetical protein
MWVYNHAHLVTFLFCHIFFWVTIYFSKKYYSLESVSHSLITENICKAFFVNVIIIGKIEVQYQYFVNCTSIW